MGKLASALAWARRGFPVFPLHENSKEPISRDWPSSATTDEELIRRLWTDPVLGTERNYNIGFCCTDFVVIDIDVKEGKDGFTEYDQLGGSYDTLVVQTPTGGKHCYFYGPDSSNSPLSRSIDIRSHNGYVLAPGSEVAEGSYQVVNDVPLRWLPPHIERMLRDPYTKQEAPVGEFEQDSEASKQQAIRFLETTPIAVEGDRGDETTFTTAARLVNEMGLSRETAFCLMRDYWNERCAPPWPIEDLWQKVLNAAEYGTAAQGRIAPEVVFGEAAQLITPPPSMFTQTELSFGNATLTRDIPARPWIVDRMLMRRQISLLLAAGSAGKSSISLALAAHLCIGRDYAGYEAKEPCKIIIYNGEDDIVEQSRRLLAVCTSHELDYEQVKQRIMLISAREIKLHLVSTERGVTTRNDTLINQLIEHASDPEVGLLILDPLVKIHECNESDNVQMDKVMDALTDIAQAADISVLALHHTGKTGTMKNEDRAGNMDISRGASAIVNASRVAFTLMGPSNSDAERFGFDDTDRGQWVRLDDAKMNLSLAGAKGTWFKKEGHRIPSGDIVGVLRHTDVNAVTEPLEMRIARILVKEIRNMSAGKMSMKQAKIALRRDEPYCANKKDAELDSLLERLYSRVYMLDDGEAVQYKLQDADKSKKREAFIELC